jgi:hypothetical protein
MSQNIRINLGEPVLGGVEVITLQRVRDRLNAVNIGDNTVEPRVA